MSRQLNSVFSLYCTERDGLEINNNNKKIHMNLKKKKILKKRAFVYAGKADAFGSFWRPGARRRTQAWWSERRHAVEVEVGPLGTAGALVLVPVGAVAVLVHALRGFVRIIVADLFVLLLLFNAGETQRRGAARQHSRW